MDGANPDKMYGFSDLARSVMRFSGHNVRVSASQQWMLSGVREINRLSPSPACDDLARGGLRVSVKVANEVSVAKDSAVSNLQNKRVPVQIVAPAKKQNEQNTGAGVAH
jgi:hypothetical protein